MLRRWRVLVPGTARSLLLSALPLSRRYSAAIYLRRFDGVRARTSPLRLRCPARSRVCKGHAQNMLVRRLRLQGLHVRQFPPAHRVVLLAHALHRVPFRDSCSVVGPPSLSTAAAMSTHGKPSTEGTPQAQVSFTRSTEKTLTPRPAPLRPPSPRRPPTPTSRRRAAVVAKPRLAACRCPPWVLLSVTSNSEHLSLRDKRPLVRLGNPFYLSFSYG